MKHPGMFYAHFWDLCEVSINDCHLWDEVTYALYFYCLSGQKEYLKVALNISEKGEIS